MRCFYITVFGNLEDFLGSIGVEGGAVDEGLQHDDPRQNLRGFDAGKCQYLS